MIVTPARTEEITEFTMLAADALCGVGTLDAPQTSDPPADAAMVLFKVIV
jgi:hypothetical protein